MLDHKMVAARVPTSGDKGQGEEACLLMMHGAGVLRVDKLGEDVQSGGTFVRQALLHRVAFVILLLFKSRITNSPRLRRYGSRIRVAQRGGPRRPPLYLGGAVRQAREWEAGSAVRSGRNAQGPSRGARLLLGVGGGRAGVDPGKERPPDCDAPGH